MESKNKGACKILSITFNMVQMKKIIIISAFYLFFISTPLFSQINYENMLHALEESFGKNVKTAEVKNLVVKKDFAEFNLAEGTIYLGDKLFNGHHALIFAGKSSFKFLPAGNIEQMQLFRFTGSKLFDQQMKFILMLFDDSTLIEIEASLNFAPSNLNNKNFLYLKNALEYFRNYNYYNFFASISDEISGGYFFSYLLTDNSDIYFYSLDPGEEEEIIFGKSAESSRFYKYFDVINQIKSSRFPLEKAFPLRVKSYKGEFHIEDNLDFSASLEMSVECLVENKAVPFHLKEGLKIDSLLINGKKNTTFYKEEEGDLLIISDSEIKKGEPLSLQIYYSGDILKKNDFGWISLKSSLLWLPLTGDREKADYDLTFKVPSKYKLYSIGEKIEEKVEGKILITRWKTAYPVRNASFNIGKFEEYRVEEEGLPEVVVLKNDFGHSVLSHSLASAGILSKSDSEKDVATDIINCIKFFNHIYGPTHLKEICAAEFSSFGGGEAFPGLINLSWDNYQGIHIDGYEEYLRAHEVAHQWWGNGVDYKTYHDKWLSEAFATYSGLWYLQLYEKDNEKFFKMLDDYKKNILGNRKYLFSSGQEAGPIWLGYRTSSSTTRGDYGLIIYRKGAWVLHMLRNMLIDLQTMNEDKFKNLMRDFYKSYYGKKASTEDFKKVVDRHFGKNMDWFFNQWVYGTSIPSYTFSYTQKEISDGSYKVIFKIDQKNVEPGFKMFIPVLIELKDEQVTRFRIEVKDETTIIELPPLPAKVKKIIFNDLNSVLCSVEYD